MDRAPAILCVSAVGKMKCRGSYGIPQTINTATPGPKRGFVIDSQKVVVSSQNLVSAGRPAESDAGLIIERAPSRNTSRRCSLRIGQKLSRSIKLVSPQRTLKKQAKVPQALVPGIGQVAESSQYQNRGLSSTVNRGAVGLDLTQNVVSVLLVVRVGTVDDTVQLRIPERGGERGTTPQRSTVPRCWRTQSAANRSRRTSRLRKNSPAA